MRSSPCEREQGVACARGRRKQTEAFEAVRTGQPPPDHFPAKKKSRSLVSELYLKGCWRLPVAFRKSLRTSTNIRCASRPGTFIRVANACANRLLTLSVNGCL